MKIKFLLLIVIVFFNSSCKNEKQTETITPELEKITVEGAVTDGTFAEDVVCDSQRFTFQLPLFQGSKEAVSRLNNDIFRLLADDFKNVTYAQGTPIEDVYKIYVNQRSQALCKNPDNGMQRITVKHVSENEDFVSFELEYVQHNVTSSLLRSYRKNGMTPIYLQELIRPGKQQDVETIYDINLQSEVASLALFVKPGDQEYFQDFIKDKVYTFESGSFKELVPGLRKSVDGSIYLQVAKQIELPNRLSYINNTIVLDIAAVELNAYLDFSKVK